jgi:hypothetical protein
MQPEGIGKLKKSNGFVGSRTRNLPCSIAPQTSTLQRVRYRPVRRHDGSWDTSVGFEALK